MSLSGLLQKYGKEHWIRADGAETDASDDALSRGHGDLPVN
jgi:hypothetical protein